MNAYTQEIERLKAENERLNKEANLNMKELCEIGADNKRLRGQVSKLRGNIIRMKNETH